jgi:hypothetical protein
MYPKHTLPSKMGHVENYLRNLFCLAACLALPCSVWGRAPFFVITPLNAGLFAEFNLVLGMLDHYEKLQQQKLPHAGLHVDFGREGLYFDPKMGTNFWQYYFEPIELGNKRRSVLREMTIHEKSDIAMHARYALPLQRCHELISRYIRIKPYIQKKVDDFYNIHFKGHYVLGVHYRGTDKSAEAPRVSYESMCAAINEHLVRMRNQHLKIFVASDELSFMEFVEHKFPGLVVKYHMERALDPTPLHYHGHNKFELGEGAMIDCLLLAKCDFLIRTSSNLSYAASQFNPNLPVRNLNKSYWE